MINQELIHKYLKGEALPNEKLEILEWIEADTKNRKEFMQYRRLYDSAVWNDYNNTAIQTQATTNARKFVNVGLKRWMQVAAVASVILVIGSLLVFNKKDLSVQQAFMQTIEVPKGQYVYLTLSDGTKVSLNSNSKLSFPSAFGRDNRTVVLNGEGYFEVSHNAQKPFYVKTQQCEVKVLGTTFNIIAYNNTGIFETSLIEGSVNVLNRETSEKILLKPNNKVKLENGKFIQSLIDSEDEFLWRKGIYVFNDEPLADVFKKLEGYYNTKIIVENKAIRNMRCTGKFRQEDGLEHLIKVLQTANNFEFEEDLINNNIVIK